MSRKNALDVVARKQRGADAGVRITVFLRHLFEPARLARRIGGVPQRILVHGLDDVQPGRVAQIVRRQVVALERGVVAVAEVDGLRIAQPGVIIARQVPEMLMRVDDRKIARVFPVSHLRLLYSDQPCV